MKNHVEHRAFTLAELLVIIGILSVLMGLILPAIMHAREAANKANCASNLRQLGIALNNYHQVERALPPGCSYQDGKDPQPHMSWLARLLPYVEREQLWRITLDAYAQEKFFLNNPPHVGLETMISTFTCPSDGRVRRPGGAGSKRVGYTSYLGLEGTNQFKRDGVLFLDSSVRITDVRDGASYTLFVGERPPSADGILGWWYAGWGQGKDGSGDMVLGVREHNVGSAWAGSGSCPVGIYDFRPPDGKCDAFHFWSHHPGGAHFLFGDNSVRFLKYSANPLMPALATRAGGEAVEIPD